MTIPKKPLRSSFYSSGNVTPVRAVSSLTFEDSNAEYGINPYSAYFSFDVFHVTATIRNPRLFRNSILIIFFAFKGGLIVLSTMTYGVLL